MDQLNKKLVLECQKKLVDIKSDILNRVQSARANLYNEERGGDEGDLTHRALAESENLNMHDRLRKQLYEIESALARIEAGTYGVCEETEEFIEFERLKAIPWTRLSIEGAEIRESLNRRYAR